MLGNITWFQMPPMILFLKLLTLVLIGLVASILSETKILAVHAGLSLLQDSFPTDFVFTQKEKLMLP